MTSLLQPLPDNVLSLKPAIPAGDQDDIELLHGISVELIAEQDREELYRKIVAAAVSIAGSQFGTMQVLCSDDDHPGHGGELQLLCHHGLPADAISFWQWVKPTAFSSCAVALKLGRRAIIPDFEEWDAIAGTAELAAFRRAGIRSAQTTPLLSRNGSLLGMISTHWIEAHQPSDRDLRLLDILARQAADLLERTIAEEALRTREQALRESEQRQMMLAGEMSHRVKNLFTLVNTMIRFGAKSAKDKEDFATSLSGRLYALAEAHQLVLAGEATSSASELRTVIEAVVEPHQSEDGLRFALVGPCLSIKPISISGLALVINELATNAIKYGALAADEGHISLSWSVDADNLSIRWEERGGTVVEAAPDRVGFGSRLLHSTIVRQFGGSFSHDWLREGVVVAIKLPLSSVSL